VGVVAGDISILAGIQILNDSLKQRLILFSTGVNFSDIFFNEKLIMDFFPKKEGKDYFSRFPSNNTTATTTATTTTMTKT